MSTKEIKVSGNSIGILGLLGVAFVILKLCKVIDWSWWWVTVPFWGPIALCLLLLLAAGLVIAATKMSK